MALEKLVDTTTTERARKREEDRIRREARAIETRRDFPEIVAALDSMVARLVKEGIPLDIAKASIKIVKLERIDNSPLPHS